MTIRNAATADIPAIVQLLKLSLGERLLPKSETFWRWKHETNPFGNSPVIVAEESGRLVGVRAFMRWQWVCAGKTYRALRAVDTATHPDFQGKGIFKKLTFELAEQCIVAGDHFIFNTPNRQSMPGYLKMGWQNLGRVPLRIKINRPVPLLFANTGWSRKSKQTTRQDLFPLKPLINEIDAKRITCLPFSEDYLHTKLTPEYLRWRYLDCPVMSYEGIGDDRFLLIFHLKKTGRGAEMRIVELWSHPEWHDSRELTASIGDLIKCLRPDFVTLAPPISGDLKKAIGRNFFLPALRVGPFLTFRPLQLDSTSLSHLNKWAFSLGEFELF